MPDMSETMTASELAARAPTREHVGAQLDYEYEKAQGHALSIAEATQRAMVRWARGLDTATYWACYALAAKRDHGSE